jgi:uncharacterized protein YqeY
MALKERLQSDVKLAMREGEAQRRDTLRMLLAAVKQVEIDEQRTLDDSEVAAVVGRQAKQRRESIADAERAGRSDLAAQEQAELAIIESYLPAMMSAEEIRAFARPIVEELGVKDLKGMGAVMSRLMPHVKGKAEGQLVNQVVRELLQGR